MSLQQLGSAALIAALLAVGGLGWWIQLQPSLEVEAQALGTLPEHIGPWSSVDVPLESTVEAVLRADYNLQRAYSLTTGEVIWLYVGYYGTARGGRPEHTPRGCYTGAGWDIEAARTVDLGEALHANEYRVARDGERRLVHFWYRSYRRTGMVGGLDQNLDRLFGLLGAGRADGALVRISTPLDADGQVAARGRLMSFAARLDPLLAERWPTEPPTD